jgi:transposase-like protein
MQIVTTKCAQCTRKKFHKCLSYKDVKEARAGLKRTYNASTGYLALEEIRKKWDSKYKYICESCERNWVEFSTFWKYPPKIRRLIYTTNPIEAYNRAMRKVMKN